ncbi:MAG: hypothetical protein R3E79_45300 [Caldilineaceae bacterium]
MLRSSPYTPTLHANWLPAALQLVSWLLLRPSAWQHQIRRVAPELTASFTLLEVSRHRWREPTLRRIFVLIYLVWPVLVSLLVALTLWGMGQPAAALLFGALFALTLGLTSGLIIGMTFSAGAGLIGVICCGLAFGLAGGNVRTLLLPNAGETHPVAALSVLAPYEQTAPTAATRTLFNSPLPTPQVVAAMEVVLPTATATAPPLQAVAVMAASISTAGTDVAGNQSALVTAQPLPVNGLVITSVQGISEILPPTVTVISFMVNSTPHPTAEAGAVSSSPIRESYGVAQPTQPSTVEQTTSPLVIQAPVVSTGQVANLSSAQSQPLVAEDNFALPLATPGTTMILSDQAQAAPALSPRGTLSSALGLTVVGMIVALTVTAANAGAPSSWRRQLGGVAVGLLVSAIVVLLMVGIALSLAMRIMVVEQWIMRYPFWSGSGQGIMVALLIGWRSQRWRRGLAAGLLLALTIIFLQQVVYPAAIDKIEVNTDSIVKQVLPALLLGPLLGIAFSLLIALPYVMAERIAGAWAGGVAGALGGGGALIAFLLLMTDRPLWPLLPLSLLWLALGLALPLWWPLLRYPLVAAGSALLLQLEQRRTTGATLLPYHPAFWDELQPLPLPGLDEHLVLAVERTGLQGQSALTLLSNGRQRWAVQAAQIELDARRLAACRSVADLPVACRQVMAGELSNAASALLRAFNRIGADVAAALAQENRYHQRLALIAVEERLDALLRELTRSNERYALRFRPIAELWWYLVHTAVATLAAAADTRQEIESPYIIGVPLTAQQAIFVGRTDIGERIEQLLRDQRHPPLLLYGQRRMGKTSLLNNLGRLLPSTIMPLFVDLQGPVALAGDHPGFLHNLARAMRDSARRQRELILPPLPRNELEDEPFTRFDEWLDAVEHTLGEATALLALDEFEVLDSAFAAGRLQAEAVLGSLRHWVQHRPRFKVLLTGSHVVEELRSWANYLINVQVVHIGYLAEVDARRLIEQPVQDFALRYEPAASQRVWELTHGHPALTQLLCYEIVALKNRQAPATRQLATVADVEAAAGEALGPGALFFHEIETGQLTDAARTPSLVGGTGRRNSYAR